MPGDPFRVVLVPFSAAATRLDVLGRTTRGLVVKVTAARLAALGAAGVPAVELFATSNEYAALVRGRSREEAVALLERSGDTALARLEAGERDRFPV